jgi:hypothetical protein
MAANIEQIKRSIQGLPSVDQDRILDWLEAKRERGSAAGLSVEQPRSGESLSWLNEHREAYLGKWVALDGSVLVAVGTTAAEVYRKAIEAGVQIPFVELVIPEDFEPFTGGWIS